MVAARGMESACWPTCCGWRGPRCGHRISKGTSASGEPALRAGRAHRVRSFRSPPWRIGLTHSEGGRHDAHVFGARGQALAGRPRTNTYGRPARPARADRIAGPTRGAPSDSPSATGSSTGSSGSSFHKKRTFRFSSNNAHERRRRRPMVGSALIDRESFTPTACSREPSKREAGNSLRIGQLELLDDDGDVHRGPDSQKLGGGPARHRQARRGGRATSWLVRPAA
jgi:hypothetical protein